MIPIARRIIDWLGDWQLGPFSIAEIRKELGARYRHKKRGTTYEVVGQARVQASHSIKEGDLLTVYRADLDGTLWARPVGEFDDGRFEEISTKENDQC